MSVMSRWEALREEGRYPETLSPEALAMKQEMEASGLEVLVDKTASNGWLYRCRIRGLVGPQITATSTSSPSGAVSNGYWRWMKQGGGA